MQKGTIAVLAILALIVIVSQKKKEPAPPVVIPEIPATDPELLTELTFIPRPRGQEYIK